jgi:hypothetical protein
MESAQAASTTQVSKPADAPSMRRSHDLNLIECIHIKLDRLASPSCHLIFRVTSLHRKGRLLRPPDQRDRSYLFRLRRSRFNPAVPNPTNPSAT